MWDHFQVLRETITKDQRGTAAFQLQRASFSQQTGSLLTAQALPSLHHVYVSCQGFAAMSGAWEGSWAAGLSTWSALSKGVILVCKRLLREGAGLGFGLGLRAPGAKEADLNEQNCSVLPLLSACPAEK